MLSHVSERLRRVLNRVSFGHSVYQTPAFSHYLLPIKLLEVAITTLGHRTYNLRYS